MVWLSTWIRARVLRWLGIQEIIDARQQSFATDVLAPVEDSLRSAYAHHSARISALAANADAQESVSVRQGRTLISISSRLVDLETAPKPEEPRRIDEDPASTWQRQRQRAEQGAA